MTNIIRMWPRDAEKEPDVVLEQAQKNYSSVLIIGWDKEGNFDARASRNMTAAEAILLCEVCKHELLSGAFGVGDGDD